MKTIRNIFQNYLELLLTRCNPPPPPRSIVNRPLTGGYNPESGVRYTDTGIPTAVQQTRRVAVQDPTLGGAPEREVPIAKRKKTKNNKRV